MTTVKKLVETSPDGGGWREVAREQGNSQLNGCWYIATFRIPARECRFIGLVNTSGNQYVEEQLCIELWEIYGSLVE
jgi:hypothetical protein